MDSFQTKVITVTGIENKSSAVGPKTVVIDQDGKKFNFYNNTKGGIPSKASQTFQQYQVGIGSTVEVTFVEEEFTTKDGTQAKTKKATSFAPTSEVAAPVRSTTYQSPKTTEPDWDKIATGKIASNLITALVENTGNLIVTEAQLEHAFNLAGRIMRFQSQPANSNQAPERPQQDEEIAVEDIPF